MDRPFGHALRLEIIPPKMGIKLAVRVDPAVKGAPDLLEIRILAVQRRGFQMPVPGPVIAQDNARFTRCTFRGNEIEEGFERTRRGDVRVSVVDVERQDRFIHQSTGFCASIRYFPARKLSGSPRATRACSASSPSRWVSTEKPGTSQGVARR